MNGSAVRGSLLLAFLALAASGPVQAKATASAEIGAFTITLFDLNPSDGIAPDFIFTGSAWSQSWAQTPDGGSNGDYQAGWPMTTAIASSDAFGSASSYTTDAWGASAEASAIGSPMAGTYRYNSAEGTFRSDVQIGPWTGVVITAPVTAVAETTIGYDGSFGEYASASGRLSISISGADGSESHYADKTASASWFWDGSQYSGQSSSVSGTVRLTFANLSDESLNGWFQSAASVYSQTALPVPEAQSVVMMLAGLIGVGAVVRRRRAGEAA